MQYLQDYDEKYPLAGNWNDLVGKYTSPAVLFCPAASPAVPDYAFNKQLAGVPLKSLTEDHFWVVGIYESLPGPNQAGGPELLPRPGRHKGGNIIGFADGKYEHIRWNP